MSEHDLYIIGIYSKQGQHVTVFMAYRSHERGKVIGQKLCQDWQDYRANVATPDPETGLPLPARIQILEDDFQSGMAVDLEDVALILHNPTMKGLEQQNLRQVAQWHGQIALQKTADKDQTLKDFKKQMEARQMLEQAAQFRRGANQ